MISKKKNYFFLKIFFFLIFVYNSLQVLDYSLSKDTFQYGDWLINYSNGFVRRGLVGEFFLIFRYFFNINLQIIYSIFLITLLGIFYFKNFLLLKNFKLNLIFLLIIFSPYFYLYTVYNHAAGIRKEYLLFIFFTFLVLDLTNKKNIKVTIKKYTIIYPILLLAHEALIFFLPFLILIFLFLINKKNIKGISLLILKLIIFSLVTIFIVYLFKGDPSYVKTLCESLKESVYNNCLNSGVIFEHFSNYHNLLLIISTIKEMYDLKGIMLFFLTFIIFFFPLIFFFSKKVNLKDNYITKKKLLIFILFSYLFTMPLFFISSDWGRWFSILFFLTFYFIVFLILKRKLVFKQSIFLTEIFKIQNNIKKIIICIAILVYSSFMTPGVFYEKKTHEKALNFNYYKIYKKLYLY